MYKPGDDKLEVRELLVKAFASAWEAGDKAVDRDTYINSSINVIDSLQVGPEMIYGEEGQGLLDDELDHLPDMLRADGAWVYYAVPAENYFILTWMEDAEKAAAKVNSLKDEDDSLACIVDLTQEWTSAARRLPTAADAARCRAQCLRGGRLRARQPAGSSARRLGHLHLRPARRDEGAVLQPAPDPDRRKARHGGRHSSRKAV